MVNSTDSKPYKRIRKMVYEASDQIGFLPRVSVNCCTWTPETQESKVFCHIFSLSP